MMPIDFCASLPPCPRLKAPAETSWSLRNILSTFAGLDLLAKYNKIMNRIYLGNFQSAKDKEFFKEKNILAVLNCSKDIPNHFAHDKNIEYMRIPVDDSLKQKDYDQMFEYMPVIVQFIHKHNSVQGNNILVHCYAGRQRSAISVAVYLVDKYGLDPKKACEMVLKKRPEAFHFGKSLNFDQALNKYYKKYKKAKPYNTK